MSNKVAKKGSYDTTPRTVYVWWKTFSVGGRMFCASFSEYGPFFCRTYDPSTLLEELKDHLHTCHYWQGTKLIEKEVLITVPPTTVVHLEER
jgi:hypothetical protein